MHKPDRHLTSNTYMWLNVLRERVRKTHRRPCSSLFFAGALAQAAAGHVVFSVAELDGPGVSATAGGIGPEVGRWQL